MNRTFKTVIITAAVTLFITRIFYGITLKPYENEVSKKIATINYLIQEKGLYDIDEKELADYAAAGLTLGVNDQYTSYYSKEQFENFIENLSNGSYVIGVVVSVNDDNKIVVQSVLEDSAAQKAGIKSADIIVEINSRIYSGEELDEAVSIMRGDGIEDIYGTELYLKLERDDKEINLKVVREKLEYNSVKSRMIDNDIGYLRILAFNNLSEDENSKDTYDEFLEKLNGLQDSGMEKLIIDLRNNPGGSLDVVKNIADVLLPKGIITYTEDKDLKRVEYKSDAKELDLPIVVLVNENSASASEVLTGALKDYEKATIIGTKTFGKGIVQTVIPLEDGSGLSLTTSKYYTPNGVCIHGIGIEPDIYIEPNEGFDLYESSAEEDIQLQTAIKTLKNN